MHFDRHFKHMQAHAFSRVDMVNNLICKSVLGSGFDLASTNLNSQIRSTVPWFHKIAMLRVFGLRWLQKVLGSSSLAIPALSGYRAPPGKAGSLLWLVGSLSDGDETIGCSHLCKIPAHDCTTINPWVSLNLDIYLPGCRLSKKLSCNSDKSTCETYDPMSSHGACLVMNGLVNPNLLVLPWQKFFPVFLKIAMHQMHLSTPIHGLLYQLDLVPKPGKNI